MKPKKVNVSINPETMELLTKMQVKLSRDLGFTPSYSQVIQHLVRDELNDMVSISSRGDDA
jgi:hypothetical protein